MTTKSASEVATEETQPRRFGAVAEALFGDNYFPPEEPEPAEVTEVTEEAPTSEEAPTTETEEEEEPESPTTETATEEEEQPIQSLPELAEHYEWDQEWLDTVTIPVKVNGEETSVSLKEMRDNYQMYTAADRRLEEAKAKAESQNHEIEQSRTKAQEQLAAAAGLIQELESELISESQSIDWNKLRQDDPAEFAAKRAEIQQRQEKLEGYKQKAVDEYRQTIQPTKPTEETLQEERTKLLQKIPEWKDAKVADREKARLVNTLKGVGYSEDDIKGASDHRLFVLARMAMLGESTKEKVNAAKKKVRKVPKVTPPGAKRATGNTQAVKKAQERFSQTRSVDDAFAVLQAKRRQS